MTVNVTSEIKTNPPVMSKQTKNIKIEKDSVFHEYEVKWII